jgi:hypothetical protein
VAQEVEGVRHSPNGTPRKLEHVDVVECLKYDDEAEDDYCEVDSFVDLYLLFLLEFLFCRILAAH